MSLFVTLQKLLPQHLLSRSAGAFAASEHPWIRGPFIRTFARTYGVDMAEAERPDLADYRSFNDFFTRALEPTARPIAEGEHVLACPADGAVSQAGLIEDGKLLQAKGIRYSFEALADVCAGPEFEGGAFLTVYLSPKDYHRVHIPTAGRLTRSVAIPGALFSVNGATEGEIEGLFARNERLVAEFETDFGKMLVIMVGALIVASIETVWDSPASPYRTQTSFEHDLSLDQGAEMGRFLLGSTVILAFEKDAVTLDPALQAGTAVRMGQAIGRVNRA
jgi:phosphatidylserine decarboxylase